MFGVLAFGLRRGLFHYTLLSVHISCEDTLFLLHSPIGSVHAITIDQHGGPLVGGRGGVG